MKLLNPSLLLFAALGTSFLTFPPEVRAQETEEFQLKFFDLTEGQLAFTSVRGNDRDIFVVDFSTLEIHPLIVTPQKEEAPEFSPDGKRIVYQSEFKGSNQIFLADANGANAKRITSGPNSNENPSWVPDGSQIIFQSTHQGESDLVLINPDGTKPQTVLRNSHRNVSPRISPRGDEILYASNQDWPGWDVFVLDLGTRKSTIITKGQGSFLFPAWHPVGTGFAFMQGDAQHAVLYYGTRGSPQAARMTPPEERYSDPAWSYRGEYLFAAHEKTPGKGDYQIEIAKFKLSADGQATADPFVPVFLSATPARHPTFTPFPSVESVAIKLKRKKSAQEAPSAPPGGAEQSR